MKRRLGAFFLSCLLFGGFADAGGPLRVTGAGATNAGQPFVWDVSNPIRYTVDGGPLSVSPSGQIVSSNSQSVARVQSLFQNWQSVPTTSITYSYAGQISGAGIPSNGDVKTIQDFNAALGLCNGGTQSPVIFDADGSLLRALGLSPLIIGFSGTCKLDYQAGHIVSALVFLNGEFQDGVKQPQITS